MGTKWTPGPWKMDAEGLSVWAEDMTMKVCNIRGWGYLAGKGSGALGLSDEEGEAIQRANGALIETAPRLYEALEILLTQTDAPTHYPLECEMAETVLAAARGEQ